QMNVDAGVGQKVYLLFGVSHLIDVPEAYVVMQVEQYDNYSYLFNSPFFISLDGEAQPADIPLRGIRIGINGQEEEVGQAFMKVDTTLGGADYDSGSGQLLSGQGAVIALQNGPELDRFFWSSDPLGEHSHVRTSPALPVIPEAPALPVQIDIGLRTFEEINATLAHMTQVPATRVA